MLRGFINVDKPQGITSFDVVRRVRRASGTKKVGHAGTLDPNATGVLPVALGEATRLVDELVGATKRYRAEVIFGVATDTYDLDGAVMATADASGLDEAALREALRPYRGEVMQRPPAYSAVKRAGVTAYRAARRGEPLDLEPRPVLVHDVTIVDFDRTTPERPRATLDVTCGKGFYVRALAHDVGQALGVGAHLGDLRRTQVGPFLADEAVPLETVERLLAAGEVETLIHAPDVVIADWPALIVDDQQAGRVRNGLDVIALPHRAFVQSPAHQSAEHRRVRCYDKYGQLIALLEHGQAVGSWHPFRVFPVETQS